ncbi:O-antigen ligase family protein [Coralliovum pocilloporae]|uniref:O-antigen ligase family protein n=1 Tax=Coralliovum pocilloporae TaxID=3066369 RepID=UPI00330794F5
MTGPILPPYEPRWTVRVPDKSGREILISFVLGFAVFLGGFVLMEPAPYELFFVILIAAWILTGALTLSRTTATLLLLLMVFTAGGFISMTQVARLNQTIAIYVLVTGFLCATSIFLASVISRKPETRLSAIQTGYLVAATIVACLGIAGYFNLIPGADVLTRYGRAKSTFEDPNVYGPFLVLGAAILTRQTMIGRRNKRLFSAAFLGILLLGILLSFSRAAWALALFSCGSIVALTFVEHRNPVFRLRLIAVALIGVGLMGLGLFAALSSGALGDLFTERLQLVQEYDSAPDGRFARHLDGFALALTSPLGIGPLQFAKVYGEDPHNLYLKSAMAYGWPGLISMILLILITLVHGFRQLLLKRPWTPLLQACFVTFLGHVCIGLVIDLDHWRHFYLLLGLLWGMYAANARLRAHSHTITQTMANPGQTS